MMMNNFMTKESKPIRLSPYALGLAVLWSVLLALSLVWTLKDEKSGTLEAARIESRTVFEKDLIYRRWNTGHGGVYVPVTEATQPNPYLDVPEREITTPSGIKLTKINPAYMTRQVHEIAMKTSGVKGHITSLNPINPLNAPDPWETQALKIFETGVKEVSSVEKMEGETYMRLMRPLVTEKGCLKCHAEKGYKLGDIRGGISVSLPMAPLMSIERSHILKLSVGHGLLWLAGLFGIGFGIRRLDQQIYKRIGAEEALGESEEKYRTLFENANEAIYVAQDGKIKFPNPKTEELYGYSAEELTSKPFTNFIHEKDQKMVLERHKKLLGGEVNPSTYPFRIINKAGDTRWVELNVVSFFWEDRPATLCFMTNITERLQAEEEQKKIEAQLQQSQKMEAMGTLAGGIAHDFNNLLMGIQGNTSLMLLNIDSSHPDYEKLQAIEKMVRSGATLTSQLLGYARKGRYEAKPINLNKLVKESVDTFSRTRKEITIHREFEENLSAIEADQVQMEQVLLNLYVNAADAMPGGGDLILKTMNITHEDMKGKLYNPRPGKYVRLDVTDTGMGMDKETSERIFEPFFTTKEMGRGTGLGLASAYGIIKAHGGYVDVESEKGRGTILSIYIPASDKEAEKEKEFPGDFLRGAETVLFVDDEDMIVNVGNKMLKEMGYTVLLARSGKDAIEIYGAKKDEIDMVILDMIMPGIGGGETYDRIKEINPDIKVLLSSGYSIDGQAEEILERGCNGFIQKPFNIKELSHKLREILDKEKS